MPRVFDNIDLKLLPTLQQSLALATRADFCVGYFNLRGWSQLAEHVDNWSGQAGSQCRLLVGMHVAPDQELKRALTQGEGADRASLALSLAQMQQVVSEFRRQMVFGLPTAQDESTLRQVCAQLRAGKLVVKAHLRHPLHAKLYLLFRNDINNPITAFVGSSNLTLAGLEKQGELNLDAMDHDTCHKLQAWFEARWADRFCFGISRELADAVEQSWASEKRTAPYLVYLKMAYHLSEDARRGIAEYALPARFASVLFDYQANAVKVASLHLNKRRGVLLGDVVGLGKSLIACALAKMNEEAFDTRTLIICPKNLVSMWQGYVDRFELNARVLSLSKVLTQLDANFPRYPLVIIDESHNLRNREGHRWRAVREYIAKMDSRCVLLSATPYNKSFLDLAGQLRLFIDDGADLGVRPERYINAVGGPSAFAQRHQCLLQSLPAFEFSNDADDWRDLMRLYLVRRTRTFISAHYTRTDEHGKYLLLPSGAKWRFPKRVPKNLAYEAAAGEAPDPSEKFYSPTVTGAISALLLPRYALGDYLDNASPELDKPAVMDVVVRLSRAGRRLIGFCRIGLFKRLESAGPAFLLSVDRHILRNYVFLHALERGLPIPIGSQDPQLLDLQYTDSDDALIPNDDGDSDDDEDDSSDDPEVQTDDGWTEPALRKRAQAVYAMLEGKYRKRFKWLPAAVFLPSLRTALGADCDALRDVLRHCGHWQPALDRKIGALVDLVSTKHGNDKVLVFTQFADTAEYVAGELARRGVTAVAAVTGQSKTSPTDYAKRFSPRSNDHAAPAGDELRVLVATDVLSEGQNLQDCAVVVNYDLPWAIIRLIQRAGRVDRIGQLSPEIRCYSFVPAAGIETLIRLRQRLDQRLRDNEQVVGADELFFDDRQATFIKDLYTEKSGILDDDPADNETDFVSHAYQIWKSAIDADPTLIKRVEELSLATLATKAMAPGEVGSPGVIAYLQTAQANDAMVWLDENGEIVSQSPWRILQAAQCAADTAALERRPDHHELVQKAAATVAEHEQRQDGALGSPTKPRYKAYYRLRDYLGKWKNKRDLFITDAHIAQVEALHQLVNNWPLLQTASDQLARRLRQGITDDDFVRLLLALHEDKRLFGDIQADADREARLICSMGLQQGEP
ncbi:MAG: NgoFVII family restriction endonuclease [Deltaproteobacteria bacterium]|nr:NgoFVII family restriction endonuclease [Deltaproteobacteria bacterium]